MGDANDKFWEALAKGRITGDLYRPVPKPEDRTPARAYERELIAEYLGGIEDEFGDPVRTAIEQILARLDEAERERDEAKRLLREKIDAATGRAFSEAQDALEAEHKQLRARLEEVERERDEWVSAHGVVRVRLDEAERDNERLRAAAQAAVEAGKESEKYTDTFSTLKLRVAIRNVAAALEDRDA